MAPGVVDTPQRERQRLDWQTKRAIVLARQALQPPPAAGSAPPNATAAAAANVPPARTGAPPTSPAATPERMPTFVEQIRARQAKGAG